MTRLREKTSFSIISTARIAPRLIWDAEVSI
jgi:hypothetical protein